MIGKSQIIIQTPYNTFLPFKDHFIGDLTLQFREIKITVTLVCILAERPHVRNNFFKNVHLNLFL
jgi:hypothetical protein